MISILRFWNTVNQRAKIGTTGYDSEEEFLNKVAEVQTEAATTLSAFYDINQNVRDMLAPFVVRTPPENSLANGENAYPAKYLKLISVTVDGVTSIPISSDQVDDIKTHPIRKPDKAKKKFRHYQANNKIVTLPEEVLPVIITYIRHPNEAKLTLIPSSSEDKDFLVPSTADGAIVDLEWPEIAFNFLLYLTLEKLGIEMKEQLLTEYAMMGINKEQIKTQVK